MSESAGRVVAEIGPVYTLLWAGTESIASIVNRMGLKVGDKLVPESLWENAESKYSECWRDYGELLTERDELLSKLEAVRALADDDISAMESMETARAIQAGKGETAGGFDSVENMLRERTYTQRDTDDYLPPDAILEPAKYHCNGQRYYHSRLDREAADAIHALGVALASQIEITNTERAIAERVTKLARPTYDIALIADYLDDYAEGLFEDHETTIKSARKQARLLRAALAGSQGEGVGDTEMLNWLDKQARPIDYMPSTSLGNSGGTGPSPLMLSGHHWHLIGDACLTIRQAIKKAMGITTPATTPDPAVVSTGVEATGVVSTDGTDAGDYMCPNCNTPWKCNGPHVPAPAAPDGDDELFKLFYDTHVAEFDRLEPITRPDYPGRMQDNTNAATKAGLRAVRAALSNPRVGEAVVWVDPYELMMVREHGGMIVATHEAEPESKRTQALYLHPPTEIPDGMVVDAWRSAVLDHLAIAAMDAPIDEPPYKTIGRVIDWHVAVAVDPAVNGGQVLVPNRATKEWAEAYCARVNRHPDGGQMSVCEGRWREISFRDMALNEINAMLDCAAAPGSAEGE
ncbi:hypothetical protein [Pseudoxanthomonas sp. CF125]|uniref:hypothetical protein n=1 Tax=Pseudoxanthomonas sp. CF125 TaxID=1855303 RepID=UPI000891A2A4|nr:hypothetical protein [Pseudoxanthomonas sp. CF125]SDQ43420.1 hypothetical protein SAMN05216569_1109 [Pseudoxanthomonas sp. CF125]